MTATMQARPIHTSTARQNPLKADLSRDGERIGHVSAANAIQLHRFLDFFHKGMCAQEAANHTDALWFRAGSGFA